MGTVRMLLAAGVATSLFSGAVSPPPRDPSVRELRERIGKALAEVRGELVFGPEASPVDPRRRDEARELVQLTRRLGPHHPLPALTTQAAAYLEIGSNDPAEVDRQARQAHSRVLRALWMTAPQEALTYPIHLARAGRPEAALELLTREVARVLRVEYGPDHPVWKRVRYEEARLLTQLGRLEEAAQLLGPLVDENAPEFLGGTGQKLALRLRRALALRLGQTDLAARLAERCSRLETTLPPKWQELLHRFEASHMEDGGTR